MGKGKIAVEKKPYLKKSELLFSEKEKILNRFKGKIFPAKNTEPEPAPTVFATLKEKKEQAKKPSSEFYADFNKETVRNETNMNAEIFFEYFKNQNASNCN